LVVAVLRPVDAGPELLPPQAASTRLAAATAMARRRTISP
jgi:hypothetical protein